VSEYGDGLVTKRYKERKGGMGVHVRHGRQGSQQWEQWGNGGIIGHYSMIWNLGNSTATGD